MKSIYTEIEIAGRKVGSGHPVFIIGEVAQTHDGSLGMAHAFIAAAETTPHEPWRVKFSVQDATRYDYWKRMEFSEQQWRGLKEHADQRGILFLSSPFSPEAVELLIRLGVPGWKAPAGEISNLSLLEQMAKTGLPVLLSSGMSDLAELDRAVECVRRNKAAVAVLQCTTAYPCPPEKIGVNLIGDFRRRFKCPVGLSDHFRRDLPRHGGDRKRADAKAGYDKQSVLNARVRVVRGAGRAR